MIELLLVLLCFSVVLQVYCASKDEVLRYCDIAVSSKVIFQTLS